MANAAVSTDNKKLLVELLLLSFISLFFELLIIRWISADIRAFTVLKSMPLAACYIGLGLGFSFNSDRTFKFLPFFFLLSAFFIRIIGDSPLSLVPFPSNRVYTWTNVELTNNLMDPSFAGYLVLFIIGVLVILAGPFFGCMAIGARLGILFNQLRPVTAYSVNLFGALLGTIALGALSFLNIQPGALLAIPCLLTVFWLPPGKVYRAVAVLALLGSIAFSSISATKTDVQTYWSPYERIDLATEKIETGPRKGELFKYKLNANKVGQQSLHELTPDNLHAGDLPEKMQKEIQTAYDNHNLPFLFKRPPGDVLSLASGLGNDVNAALRNGASSVDAVEIDPITIELAKKYNREQPYQSPKVHIYCDDARHFLEKTDKKYDIIRFSFIDSMTVLSQSSTNRLDNYVYTKESIQEALTKLKPDGYLFISFFAKEPWFINKLFWTISEAAGYKPLCFAYKLEDGHNVFFVLSQSVKNGTIELPRDMPPVMPGPWHMIDTVPKPPRVLTDDWPFIYWTTKGFDVGYAAVTLTIVSLALFFGRKMVFATRYGSSWQMFFLGAAFLLLELQAIARCALLYGTTWITSSVVISGVLTMLLFANMLVYYKSGWLYKRLNIWYALLAVTLLASYFSPNSWLLASGMPPFLSYGIVTFISLLPMFVAGIIFSSSFDHTKRPSIAIGFNLLGGVLGALLEYFTSYTGINAMVLVALGLYAISFLCLRMLPAQPEESDAASAPAASS